MDPFGFQSQGPINMTQGRQMPGMPNMPKTSYTGLMQSEMAKNALAAQEMQKRADLAALAQQMAQMEEYQKNAGWRDMARQAGTETSRGQRDTAYAGAQTKLGKEKLDLRKGMATEASDIGAAQAKNQTVMSEARMKQMENLADELNTMELDPMTGSAQVSAVLDSHGVRADHPLRQKLMSIQDPAEFKTRVSQLGKQMQNTVAAQRAMAAQGAKDEAHMDRTKAEIAGRERVAQIQADAHKAAAQGRTTKDSLKIEADLVKALREAQSTTDPAIKAAKMAEAQQLFQMLQMIRSAGAPTQILPGAEGIERVRPQAQPLPGTTPQAGGVVEWTRDSNGRPVPKAR